MFCLRREPVAPPRHDLFWAIAVVAVLWLNFAPVLYMLVTRCVEGWELFLIAGAIYAALTGRHAWSGAAIAAAALIKTLPAFFMLILLLRDRRAFAAACVTGVALLACSHALYGPEMGALYPVRLAATASSKYTPAFTMFENMAVKSMVAKALGHLQPPGPDGAPKSGPYLDGLDGDPQTGAYLVISKERLSAANSVGAVWSLALVAWCIWAVVRPATSSRPYDLFWSWSFADVVMLVVSPMVAFEYTVLLLPAFSFACAAIVYRRGSANWWWIAGAFAVAVFLVGNIVPRQIVLRVIPVAWLTSLNPSNVHLSPTEAYLHYGFPMIGLVLLLLVVWALRPRLQPSHP